MQLIKLDPSFYPAHTHLIQALDNHNGVWDAGKIRGYGVVVITINNLTFAIPLRTNINHTAAYITVRNKQANASSIGKGLDFSKSLLITNTSYLSSEKYKIPPAEHQKLLSKQHHITQLFEKYVSRYIAAKEANDTNILNSNEYRHTTLQNYHAELGIVTT